MKKMFIASCIMAAAVFAAPAAKAPAAEPAAAPAAAPAKTEAKAEAKPAAEAKEEAKAEPAPAPAAAPAAEAKTAEAAPAAEVKTEQPAEAAPAAEEAKTAEEAPAEAAAEQPKEEVAKAEEAAPAAEVAAAEPEQKPAKKKKRKKKKMIQNAVMTVNQINFDINADFELEAGKVLWNSEEDVMRDNLETWKGEANFAVLAETEDFKGKIGVAFYPGDLKSTDDNIDKKVKKEQLREGTRQYADDYFSLDEAWAMQETDLFTFKVGRWDNTDKNGDYFGGYIDGYKNGFLSTQDPENQFEFGFIANENMDIALSFISKASYLNKGDLRVVFNFHDLPSLELFDIQLGYRSNIFDKVHDSDAKIFHNASLKVRAPIIPNFLTLFGEAALMDLSDDLAVPVTGGIELNFKTVDRVILEAEYVYNRKEHGFYEGHTKHVKDVLAAIYLEKALTDRFSLSAGFHSYKASKDFMLSGNLVGRIN